MKIGKNWDKPFDRVEFGYAWHMCSVLNKGSFKEYHGLEGMLWIQINNLIGLDYGGDTEYAWKKYQVFCKIAESPLYEALK